MTLEDCAQLVELFAQVPGNVDPREELPRALTRSWVACETATGRLLGYALGWWIVDELQLLAIATWPDARRQGVGRRLLEAVVGAARAAGAARLTLEVARGNAPALSLYQSAGFECFHVRRGYYRHSGEDALELELRLSAAPGP
jgi:ribosomal-protein-alanine N-acetyltransferase